MALLFRRICLVVFVSIGIMMLFQSIHNIVRINATEKWVQTEASVGSVHVINVDEKRGGHFDFVITYDYKINGMMYSGDRLNFEGKTLYNTEWEATNESETYLNKDDKNKILIYYDPENPESSVISRGTTRNEYFLMSCGVIFLAIGLLANRKEMIALIKRLNKKNT